MYPNTFWMVKWNYSIGVSNRLQCQQDAIVSPKTPTNPPNAIMVG